MQGSRAAAFIVLGAWATFALLVRLSSELVYRVGQPGPYVPPSEMTDYSAEYDSGAETSVDRMIPTRKERAPGVVVAIVMTVVAFGISAALFHELGFLAILLAIFSIFLAVDTARVITNHRMRKRPTKRSGTGAEGIVS